MSCKEQVKLLTCCWQATIAVSTTLSPWHTAKLSTGQLPASSTTKTPPPVLPSVSGWVLTTVVPQQTETLLREK